MKVPLRAAVTALPMSATLAANQAAAQRRRAGKRVLHMGFGQSPFPVHALLAEELAAQAGSNLYEHVAGVEALREGALAYFADACGVERADYEIIVAPGSKLILYALQMAIDGDLLLPVPSWVSYDPQAALLGDRVIPVDAAVGDAGLVIDAERLSATIERARRDGANPTKLILNSPNNPTGLCIPPHHYADIAEVCMRENVFVISDEIYGRVAFDEPHRSIAAVYPHTAVTTGLSKHLSLGGWRVGFGLIPRRAAGLFEALCAIASETWSSVSAPVQRAAIVAVSQDPALEQFIDSCTRIHAAVARTVATALRGDTLLCPWPSGAFYLWPDFAPLAQSLARQGIRDSEALARRLLDDYQVLALPGSGFGAPPGDLFLRLSVCDYDGAEALEVCAGADDPGPLVGVFAPRVVEAADAIGRFAADAAAM